MTVADQNPYPTGTATVAFGSRPGGSTRGEGMPQLSNTFSSLLIQDLIDPNENVASTSSADGEPSASVAAAILETVSRKSLPALASAFSAGTQTAPSRKKITGEPDASAPSSIVQPPDLPTPVRWLLSLICNTASTSAPTTSASRDLEVHSQDSFSGQSNSTVVPSQQDEEIPDRASLPNLVGKHVDVVANAISGATQGSVYAPSAAQPFDLSAATRRLFLSTGGRVSAASPVTSSRPDREAQPHSISLPELTGASASTTESKTSSNPTIHFDTTSTPADGVGHAIKGSRDGAVEPVSLAKPSLAPVAKAVSLTPVSATSTGNQTSSPSAGKKTIGESDAAATAPIAQSTQLSTARRPLKMSGGDALAGSPAASPSVDLRDQLSDLLTAQSGLAAGPDQQSKVSSDPAGLLNPIENRTGRAGNGISGATQEFIDPPVLAESALAPVAKAVSPTPVSATSTGNQTSSPSAGKKTTGESDAAATAPIAQSTQLSTARRPLKMSGGDALAGSPAASPGVDLRDQLSDLLTAQSGLAAGPDQQSKVSSDPAGLLDLIANRTGRAGNGISGTTQGFIDAPVLAELALTPVATPAIPPLAVAPKFNSSLTSPPATPSPIRLQAASDPSSQSQVVIGRNVGPEIRTSADVREGESAHDLLANPPQKVAAVSNKKSEAGSPQLIDSPAPTLRGGGDSAEFAVPIATRPAEPKQTSDPAEVPTHASPVREAPLPDPVRPFGSSVGMIELQVKGADEQQVGLRFVERQGHVEIQLKSSDAQTAQALADNLPGLKTSLNENGWDVESRIQARLSQAGQGPQSEASADRRSVPPAQFEPANFSSRASLSPASGTVDQQLRESADQLGAPRPPRAEQVSTGQMNHQNGADSSPGQDEPRPDRDGPSGRNGQHARNESAGGDTGRQGRRPARDSEAWLDSIESNLTGSKSSRFTSGVIK